MRKTVEGDEAEREPPIFKTNYMSAVDFEYCKDEAIAFGEWLAKEGYTPPTVMIDMMNHMGTWKKAYSADPKWYTTEELYQEFIKTRQG